MQLSEMEKETIIHRLYLGFIKGLRQRMITSDTVSESIKGKTLCVLFGGVWGCKIQLWLEGNVDFCVKSREDGDPYWMDSSLFMENGYIYLVDECDMTAEKITDDYCWFKAKSVSYQVLPD